jgi:predicted  nucleic acid-binding Zn-ribbon protein
MDLTTAVVSIGSAVVTGAATVFGWLVKRSVSQLDRRVDAHETALKEQSETFHAYKLHVAETYVTGNELSKAIDAFNRSIDAVFAKLDRIEEKLDKKADK